MSRLPIVLAGDIGGTKTLLGLFDARSARPEPMAVTEFPTLDHPDLLSIVATFLDSALEERGDVIAACFGVAGPITGNSVTLTNVPRQLDGDRVSRDFNIPRVVLLNDLEAMAYSLPVLRDDELCVLQRGTPRLDGDMALVAAGTGLGEAVLRRMPGVPGMKDRYIASPSESGHTDFPARTAREIDLLQALTSRYGRVSIEHVLSGNGLVNLHRFTHAGTNCPSAGSGSPDPATISKAGLERSCAKCVETLELFAEAYGAEAGNLALRTLPTGGVFVGGGIAPRILPALTDGRFVRAFNAKPPMDRLLAAIPVRVVLNPQVGLLGAAVQAAGATR